MYKIFPRTNSIVVTIILLSLSVKEARNPVRIKHLRRHLDTLIGTNGGFAVTEPYISPSLDSQVVGKLANSGPGDTAGTTMHSMNYAIHATLQGIPN